MQQFIDVYSGNRYPIVLWNPKRVEFGVVTLWDLWLQVKESKVSLFEIWSFEF